MFEGACTVIAQDFDWQDRLNAGSIPSPTLHGTVLRVFSLLEQEDFWGQIQDRRRIGGVTGEVIEKEKRRITSPLSVGRGNLTRS